MAITGWKHLSPFYLIHHSDRGIQYCCNEYTEMLRRYGIAISMTQSGSPYDNALAERVNGILKNEFYPKREYQNHKDAAKNIDKIIKVYNLQRPHVIGKSEYTTFGNLECSKNGNNGAAFLAIRNTA